MEKVSGILKVAMTLVVSLLASVAAFGQSLQLSPPGDYDSIRTRTSATIASESGVSNQASPAGVSVGVLPESVDLRKFLPPVGMQSHSDDCVAWAFAHASYSCQICQTRLRSSPKDLYEIFSPAFVYNQLKGNESGLTAMQTVELLKKKGCASLATMSPGDDWPSANAQVEAYCFRAIDHERADKLSEIKAFLSDGFPVILIAQMDATFRAVEATPNPWEWLGEVTNQYHAITAVGYDSNKKAVLIMNSWGDTWKDKGFCWVAEKSLQTIDRAHWCAEAHVLKVKESCPVAVSTKGGRWNKSRSFQLKQDQEVYETVYGKTNMISSSDDNWHIQDVACDATNLYVLRDDQTVQLMRDSGAGSQPENRQWLHLTYGPMANESATMIVANIYSPLYILTSDGDIVEYHERTSNDGDLVKINPPLANNVTTIDIRLFGNELRATTTAGDVFVHYTNDDATKWSKADTPSN